MQKTLDFFLFELSTMEGRYVAGFGQAYDIDLAAKKFEHEAWTVPVESPMGSSTPLEEVGGLMYHTGIHSGQISL
nr:hypothetical protein [Paenibacillus allorhizoplanae]